jgi:hypothetical protein
MQQRYAIQLLLAKSAINSGVNQNAKFIGFLKVAADFSQARTKISYC